MKILRVADWGIERDEDGEPRALVWYGMKTIRQKSRAEIRDQAGRIIQAAYHRGILNRKSVYRVLKIWKRVA